MSDAGVKFRESPMKWLKGLNLRSTRLAFGIYMESHIVQLIMVTLIIVDVCAVFGELLLANVCDTSRDVRACMVPYARRREFHCFIDHYCL